MNVEKNFENDENRRKSITCRFFDSFYENLPQGCTQKAMFSFHFSHSHIQILWTMDFLTDSNNGLNAVDIDIFIGLKPLF